MTWKARGAQLAAALLCIAHMSYAQTDIFAQAMREFNTGNMTQARLTFWSAQFAQTPPKVWGITPPEYTSVILSIEERLPNTGDVHAALLLDALATLQAETAASSPFLLPLLDRLAQLDADTGKVAAAMGVDSRALAIAETEVGPTDLSLAGRLRIDAVRLRLALTPESMKLAEALEQRAANLETALNGVVIQGAPSTPPNSELVKVFYATNRMPDPHATEASTFFTTHRDNLSPDLHFGSVTVSVPREDPTPGIPDGRLWVGVVTNASYRKATLVTLDQIGTADEFQAAVRQRLDSTTRHELMIYIHGYATDWKTSVQRAAALSVALELDGAPLLFSWPSRGDVLSYVADGNEKTDRAVNALADLVYQSIKHSHADRIYIVSHSMGARFLIPALKAVQARDHQMHIADLIFASPDVDAPDFSDQVPAITRLATRTTLYMSQQDRALKLSSFVNNGPRAGQASSKVILNGLDTVDTSQSAHDLWSVDGFVGHNDFALGALDDMRAVVWHDLVPAKRCILSSAVSPAGVFWRLNGNSGCQDDTFRMGIHAARRLGLPKAASYLQIEQSETCISAPTSKDCAQWKAALAVANSIPK